jgi:hypothetical protein
MRSRQAVCVVPRASKVPTPPERQAVQTPQDPIDKRIGLNARRRRGMWASVFTSPRGVIGLPAVTGMSAPPSRLTTLYPSDRTGG